jgi:SAM-dependent methyltransferase
MKSPVAPASRTSFGTSKLSLVDEFGVWLSQRAIADHIPKTGTFDVLEIGCGFNAKNLQALGDRVRHGVGIDFAIADELKRGDRLEFIEGPFETSLERLEGRSFDVILFISVLEHLWDPLAALNRCHEWLRPGGVLFVNVPTWTGKTFLEFSAFKLGTSPACEMEDHKMYYDKRDLWPLLVKAGFAPSKIAMKYHKFGLNLFATVRKSAVPLE